MNRVFIALIPLLLGACSGTAANGDGDNFIVDARPMAQTLVYECTGMEVLARIGAGEMALWLPDRYLVLSQVRAASGSKYEEGEVVFWSRGEEVLLQVGADRYTDCQLNRRRAPWEDARRRGVDFRASGNEPGWVIEVKEGEQLLYEGDYGARRILARTPGKTALDSGFEYRAVAGSDRLEVRVSELSCHDSMSGARFPLTVELQLNGAFYQGCGMPLDYPWE